MKMANLQRKRKNKVLFCPQVCTERLLYVKLNIRHHEYKKEKVSMGLVFKELKIYLERKL
jgi:hypothetical protein